jgi:hypothetical protein
MQSIPEILHVLENLSQSGTNLLSEGLQDEDYQEYSVLKEKISERDKRDARKLKISAQLKSKLFGLIFSFNPSKSKFNLAARKVVEVIRLSAVADLFAILGFGKPAQEVQKSVYSKSKKYDYNKGILNSSRFLFMQEAQAGNRRKALGYYNECLSALQIDTYEIKCQWYSADLRNHFAKSKEMTSEIREKARTYYEELKQLDKQYFSRIFYLQYIVVGIIHFESIFEYEKLCAFLQKNLNEFRDRFPFAVNGIISFQNYLINYSLHIMSLDVAKLNLTSSLEKVVYRSSRWFRIKELNMLYGLRSGDLNLTIDIYNELSQDARYKRISAAMRNRIELLWLYASMSQALQAGRTKGVELLKDVRLGRYLNSIPEFFVDKKGMNVPIIIVQLLYYIILRDLDRLDDRFEAVEKYLTRYMRNDPLYRANSFVKMLLQVPKQNFHPVAVERHANRYYSNLKSLPFLESKHPMEIELLDFEILWEQVMSFLRGR